MLTMIQQTGHHGMLVQYGLMQALKKHACNQFNNKWLIVRYDDNKKTKKIQKFCSDIKSINDDY